MLLVADVGNTNVVLGLYREDQLLAHWRLSTNRQRTADEYAMLLRDLFGHASWKLEDTSAVVLSCVVPPLMPVLEEMIQRYLHLEPLVVEPGIRTGMPILYDNPAEVGADRIVNAVAAYERYGGPVIVVDFGTATTFDVVSGDGGYLGGAIAPGVGISTEALFTHAAKLPRVELVRPRQAIGRHTVASMQAGIVFGFAGQVDALVRRIQAELGDKAFVVATGGLVHLIAGETQTVDRVDPLLTLEGLRLIWERNRPEAGRAAPTSCGARERRPGRT